MHNSMRKCYGADMGGWEQEPFVSLTRGLPLNLQKAYLQTDGKAQGFAQLCYSDKTMLRPVFSMNKCKKNTHVTSVTTSSSGIIFICLTLCLLGFQMKSFDELPYNN